MAKKLSLRELADVLTDAKVVITVASVPPHLEPVAYREVVRELLDNEYVNDLP